MSLHLTRAEPRDAALVREIMLAAFAEYDGVVVPQPSALRETIEETERSIREGGGLLVFDGEAAVGSGRFQPHDDHLYVGRLAVLPSHRGRGIALLMMQELERIAGTLGLPEIRLSTRLVLKRNVSLYKRLGYEVTATLPHPAQFTVDMAKRLA